MSALGTDVVDVLNAPLVASDRYGSRARDWGNATTTTVPGCAVQPIGGTEANLDRQFTATHVRLFAPPSAPIEATSRVTYRGGTYEVDGEPERWNDSHGQPAYQQVTLKVLKG